MEKVAKKTGANKVDSSKSQEEYRNFTEKVRTKARELWEKKGRIQGKDLDIWLEAERMVKNGKR